MNYYYYYYYYYYHYYYYLRLFLTACILDIAPGWAMSPESVPNFKS